MVDRDRRGPKALGLVGVLGLDRVGLLFKVV
jgi:hypothetical protein